MSMNALLQRWLAAPNERVAADVVIDLARALPTGRPASRQEYDEDWVPETHRRDVNMAELPPMPRPLQTQPETVDAPGTLELLESPGVSAELLGEAEIAVIMQDLNRLPNEMATAQARVIDLEVELAGFKSLHLPKARADVDLAINAATMEAHTKGLIDGKNAEQRKVQLDSYLAKDANVATAQAALAKIEGVIASIEAQVAMATGEFKSASNRFAATRAQAELWSARLRALAALA